jgi:hypothetical protein
MRNCIMTKVILLAAAAGVLSASSVVHLGFTDLSRLARRVVVGRIERITSYQDTASGRIHSRVEIAESRSIAGAAPAAFTFEMIGGAVGDLRQWLADFPQLQEGDRVVLFLAEDTNTPFGPTIGLWQGVFFIDRDPLTGVDVIADHRRRPLAEIRGDQLITVETPAAQSGSAGPRRAGSAARLTLDAFLSRVSTLRAEKTAR